MAETISAIVQFKRMTRAQWSTSQYVPKEGEMVCESDTGFVKVGDGTHRFPDLRYLTGPQGIPGPTGQPGPPGRDGVVTFESLSQAQINSLKGDRGEPGTPGPAGERGHSLTANVRIEGNYRNGVNSQLNVIADVYYDGTRLTSGYTVDFYYRGFGNNNWTSQLNQRPDANGKFAQWSSAQRSGGYLEVYIVVTYQGIKAAASTRLDNVQDGARGANGDNSYIHIKYSDSQNGDNMDNDSTRLYMGIYTGNKATPPTNASEYTWSKIRGNEGASSNENLVPDSSIGNTYNKLTWEDKVTNSGLNFHTGHAINNLGRGLHIYGTPNAEYKGLSSAPFNLVAKQGDKLTLSMDLGKDALTEHSTLRLGLHYITSNNQIASQEWQDLDLATQGFEVRKYKRISRTFTVGSDITYCRVMIYATAGRLINFYIDNIKLERGSVATEWCPAYEDLKTPVHRIAKADIEGRGIGSIANITTNDLINPDGVKVGDIIEDWWSSAAGTDREFWLVTAVNGTNLTVKNLAKRTFPTYNDTDIKRRITTLENRPAATGFVNQKTGQAMNYWMGSKQEFDAISNKDANTVYDYYE